MRTKKILSILLVMIMALGLLGVAASAEEPVLTGEEASVQADAPKGWSEVTGIYIAENIVHTDGSGTAQIRWDAFPANTATKEDGFHTLYAAAPAGTKATATWVVERQNAKTGEWAGIPVATDKVKANASSGAYFTVNSTYVTLFIGQAAVSSWYGRVRATLTIAVPSIDGRSFTSNTVETMLIDTTKLAEKINDAQDELKKTDRYTEKFLKNLKVVLDLVNGDYSTHKLSQAEVDWYIDYLELALQGKNANGESMGLIYKLADKNGEGFIDATILNQGIIAFIWDMVDFFNTAMLFINPMIDFFGEVGNFFGYLMPFFSLFGGILGL